MKLYLLPFMCCLAAGISCTQQKSENLADDNKNELAGQLKGSWRLLSAVTLENGKTTVQDYSKAQRMIKIINDDHFAFLKHDLKPSKAGKNNFDAGGGSYKLIGDQYTESLDFYNDPNWEGKSFTFTIKIQGDTLVQTGVEKVEKAGVDRTITEKYLRETAR
ncbi:hypothetical protein [Pedobacter antarcticus]|uniref:hypothetical protein n=1 Tax=Pedobacter antarcticus TaxID=34086 RepID=UPI00088462FB|nr:hypothetical protein [Pedobacter antarcticus]SDL41269.1 hypothetical protein SAMN04488084_101205 [Pedobacter antarcticus]